MSSVEIGGITFGCVFGGALVRMFTGSKLPVGIGSDPINSGIVYAVQRAASSLQHTPASRVRRPCAMIAVDFYIGVIEKQIESASSGAA